MKRGWMYAVVSIGIVFGAVPSGATPNATVADVDAAWSDRGVGSTGGFADSEVARQAVDVAQELYESTGRDLRSGWRLMRALWFQGDYVELSEDQRRAVVDRGIEVAALMTDRLAERHDSPKRLEKLDADELADLLGGDSEAAPVLFWSAISWGAWGQATGKVAAARKGVGSIIRHFSAAVVRLDPDFERGGGRRVYGRLHSEAPRIPFFTGWVDRDLAISELERAVADFPDFAFNRWYLVDALRQHRPDESDRTRALLEDLAAREPSKLHAVEDARIIESAAAALRLLEN